MHRHHKNPLLKEFVPNIYRLFRERDIILLEPSQHSRYHSLLKKDKDFQILVAECQELDYERTCGEYVFAECLDALWDYFLRTHSEYDIKQAPGS